MYVVHSATAHKLHIIIIKMRSTSVDDLSNAMLPF